MVGKIKEKKKKTRNELENQSRSVHGNARFDRHPGVDLGNGEKSRFTEIKENRAWKRRIEARKATLEEDTDPDTRIHGEGRV